MNELEVKLKSDWLKIFLIVLIFIAILAIFTYLIYSFISDKKEVTENTDIGTNEQIEFSFLDLCLENCKRCEQNCKDQDVFSKAEDKIDKNLCNEIIDDNLKSECVSRVVYTQALNSKDKSLCNSIESEDEKQRCIFSVVMKKATDSKDETMCDELGDQAESCKNNVRFTLARETNDPSYCDKITNSMKNDCLNFIE